jgi:ribosome-associated translation inhibitor RaiA
MRLQLRRKFENTQTVRDPPSSHLSVANQRMTGARMLQPLFYAPIETHEGTETRTGTLTFSSSGCFIAHRRQPPRPCGRSTCAAADTSSALRLLASRPSPTSNRQQLGVHDASRLSMQVPLDITFRGMAPSTFVDVAVATWLERLSHVYDRIQHCHLWIDLPHRHRPGLPFQVKLMLAVPGTDSVVVHTESTDVYIAIANAFLAARRRMQDIAQMRRGEVKHHAA